MSDWKLKRFWESTGIRKEAAGYAVLLDDRGIKTPAKTPLIVPTRKLAKAIAGEWQAQDGEIDPSLMPFTRLANSALDKVTPQHRDVTAYLAEYGGSDLLCYRAGFPT